jgi:hypothetical protein
MILYLGKEECLYKKVRKSIYADLEELMFGFLMLCRPSLLERDKRVRPDDFIPWKRGVSL